MIEPGAELHGKCWHVIEVVDLVTGVIAKKISKQRTVGAVDRLANGNARENGDLAFQAVGLDEGGSENEVGGMEQFAPAQAATHDKTKRQRADSDAGDQLGHVAQNFSRPEAERDLSFVRRKIKRRCCPGS